MGFYYYFRADAEIPLLTGDLSSRANPTRNAREKELSDKKKPKEKSSRP